MERYFLTSRHGNCGSSVMFHNKDERGYGTNLDNLETYSKEEAQKHHEQYGRESLPLLVDKVLSSAKLRVDCQYLDIAEGCPRSSDEVCVVSNGSWIDGNDIGFEKDHGGVTYNLEEAKITKLSELKGLGYHHVIWSVKYIATKARKTFQFRDINTRSMCRGVKLKRKATRQDSGKTRWNCPCCGQINWQYNPYDFEGCRNSNCDEWVYLK